MAHVACRVRSVSGFGGFTLVLPQPLRRVGLVVEARGVFNFYLCHSGTVSSLCGCRWMCDSEAVAYNASL